MGHTVRYERAMLWGAFCAGAGGWLIANAVTPGEGTIGVSVPLSWAWSAVAAAQGNRFADTHQWMSTALASIVSGVALAVIYSAARATAMRLKCKFNEAWVLLVAVTIYMVFLFSFPIRV